MNITIQEIINIILNLTLLDIFYFVVASLICLLIAVVVIIVIGKFFNLWDKVEDHAQKPNTSWLWIFFPLVFVFIIIFGFFLIIV